jgi:APA family basic amino acid/polyamine antiporter
MVVGTIIGAAIFVQPSEITGQVPSVTGIFLVWLLSGALTVCGALVCAELASTFSRTGGVYVYLSEAFSPAIGFLWGWAMFWVMHSGIIAAIAIVFARYVGFFISLSDAGTKSVAIGAILALSAVNYAGVKHGARLQALFTLGKLLAIALIIVLGFALGGGADTSLAAMGSPPPGASGGGAADAPLTLEGFIAALVAGLFAYGGWHMVTYSSEETVTPRKTIPRALLFGTAIVTLIYVGMNAVYLYVLPLETVAASTRVAADLADAVLGFGGGAVMSGLVIFSTFGALSGIILAGPRVYYAMAQDGLLFPSAGRVHPRFRTPGQAIALQAVWASVLVASGTYRALFSRVIYTEWLFFGLLAIGLIRLRGRADLKRGYSILGYPVIPIVFALASFFIVFNHIAANARDSAYGLSLVLLGLPVYVLWASKRARVRGPSEED